MKIQITGRHIDVTDALKQYSEEKVSSLEKLSQRILNVHVLLEVQNSINHRCEINVEANHSRLSAHAESKNMYESINKCIDKLAHQLRSNKQTYGDKNHRTATKNFEHEIIEAENAVIEESV
ncbi:MAG: hypothetical protein ACD_79C00466G0011 [uncultured bacterium]|nr:MAG: hypothetical protein ACD_79C00466G0011 [uncultured bacterium]